MSRRYSSSTIGWISTSTSGKRRGVRRRERNERLVLDVCRSFFSFPFLFLPSPSRSRGTMLFRRFYLRGNSKGDGQRRCNRFWHADATWRRRRTFSSSRVFRPCNTLNFFLPSFSYVAAFRPTKKLVPCLRQHLFISSLRLLSRFRSVVAPSAACHVTHITIFHQFFKGFEFPRNSLLLVFRVASCRRMFNVSLGKLITGWSSDANSMLQ